MEHGAPCLAVDVEGQSNLVSWCTSTGLLAVGCTPSLHNGAATVRIIPLSSPSVASTLHIPLEGSNDQLVASAFSTAAPPTGTSRPRLLLTATRSGRVCCWSQQAPTAQPSQPTTWDRWFCQAITPPAASSSSPDHPAVKAEEGEDVRSSPKPSSSSSSLSSSEEVVSASWLHVKAPWAWNAAAGQQALDSYSSCSQHTPASVTARLDAPFYQQLPTQAAPAAAAGSPFSWLSRASLAFAVVYRSGKVRLYWSVLGRDSQLRWSSTALLQLPATSDPPPGDPAPAAPAEEVGSTAVAPGAGNVVLMATGPSNSSSSSSDSNDGLPTSLCLYQISGDPVYAAAAAAAAPAADAAGAQAARGQEGPMQPQLPVTLVTRHTLPGDMRVTALAWCPAGAAQRLAVLLEPRGALPPPAAPGAAAVAPMTVQLLDVSGEQVTVAGQVTLRRRLPPGGPLPNSSSGGSDGGGRCVWSHDASWLAITTSRGACVVLDAHELLPLQDSWVVGPSSAAAVPGAAAKAAAAGGQVRALAPSPNSCMVAVLHSSTAAAAPGQPETSCLQLWGVLGGRALPSGNSQQQQQQQGAHCSRGSSPAGNSSGPGAEQLCAMAVGRCLWCLSQGTHTWDVTQLLLALPRPAAPLAATTPPPAAAGGADLPAALSAVDVAVMRHPQATRSVLSQRWDVLKLGVMQRVPGEDAMRLAQELRLRLYILRVLKASMVLAEGAIMYWSRHRKVDPDRVNNEDVLAVHRWNHWFIRAIHLLLRVAKTWALAQQQQQQQPPAAADADPAAAAVGNGAAAGAGGEVPLVRLLLDADLRGVMYKVATISHRILGATESWLGGSKSLPQGSDATLKMWIVLTNEVQYKEEAAPSPAALAEAFPSPYQLHYNRPLPPAAALTGRLEALAKHNSWAQPHGFAPISPGEVGDMLQRWGLGWEVPPHVQAQYARQLQLHSSFRCGRSPSPGSSLVAAGSRKRPVSPAGALDLMVVEEEGGPAGVMAAAKRGRWQAALQLAMGHPQACFTAQVRASVNANGTDPLSRGSLAHALQKQTAAASAAAALQGSGTPAAPQQQMLLALDGSLATTVGLGSAAGGGGGTGGDKPRGVAVVQPQQVAWVGASPITGELWERRAV